jgi:methyl-accepting chemotaxis protein
MAESRTSLTRMLYLNGALAVAVLTVLVYLLLRWVTALAGDTSLDREVLLATLGFFVVTGVGAALFFRWIASRLIGPLDSAEIIASRVAAGNLLISDLSIDTSGRNGGQMMRSLGAMVSSLRSLTSAIQGASRRGGGNG